MNVRDVDVADAEYRRLLGYPRGSEPSPRALELAAAARAWFRVNARPWIYYREAALCLQGTQLAIDGMAFNSPALREHLAAAGATSVVLLAVSGGAACEAEARRLWEESKPDEYFFLETYGSAAVEHLVARANARVCAEADANGTVAVPHYSPGYGKWDVAEQNQLFAILRQGATGEFPEPLEVLSSGMLRPKKSLLGVIGLASRRVASVVNGARAVPCTGCSFSPCAYRRAPYRHANAVPGADPELPIRQPSAPSDGAEVAASHEPLTRNATYSVNPRALHKWAQERVQLRHEADGTLLARFRFDGTTCTNMGRPLAFEYRVLLGDAGSRYRIVRAECRPAEGDEGHRFMCEYQRNADALMTAIAREAPLIGQSLDDVLQWQRPATPSGCYCDPSSRLHKWGLALEAIHYALVHETLSADRAATPLAAAARP